MRQATTRDRRGNGESRVFGDSGIFRTKRMPVPEVRYFVFSREMLLFWRLEKYSHHLRGGGRTNVGVREQGEQSNLLREVWYSWWMGLAGGVRGG